MQLPRVAMDANSQEKAIQEARDKVKAYAEAILGAADASLNVSV